MTRGVGVERIKITVAVGVGEGVSVARVGVRDGLGVRDGMAAAVRVPAAMTVWAMKVLAAPGSMVGIDGAASCGTHAMMSASAVIQTNNLLLRVAVIISSSTSDEHRNTLLSTKGTKVTKERTDRAFTLAPFVSFVFRHFQVENE